MARLSIRIIALAITTLTFPAMAQDVLDKDQAGALGQDLVVEGLVDLRTLAGGISITSQGLEMLHQALLMRFR